MRDEEVEVFVSEFRRRGYLAESMQSFQAHVRRNHDQYLLFSSDLNELAQRIYSEVSGLIRGRGAAEPMCVGIQIMPRVLSGFQAAVMLAERGMHIESLTLTRGVYESAFWIGYLNQAGERARDQLFSETLAQELELRRLTLDGLGRDSAAHAARREEMRKLGKEMKRYSHSTMTTRTLARLAGFGPRYPEYRYLCGIAAHVSVSSLIGYLDRGDDGSYLGHSIGPDEGRVSHALMFSCIPVLIALDAIRSLTKTATAGDGLGAILQRWTELEEADLTRRESFDLVKKR